MIGMFGGILVSVLAVTVAVMLVIFIVVPLFKGAAYLIGYTFGAIVWLVTHIFTFIGGMLGDAVRFLGSLIAMVVLLPMVPLNIIFGRWSAAGHFAESVKRECQVGAACVYRIVLQRPLKLLMLHGLLEGLEQRVPEAVYAAPPADKPNRRTGQFDGYTIVGSLRAGGSGAKLYIAQPNPEKRARFRHMTDHVVIKSFALTEGSSLPQIVRESRALECAKQLGLVFDHGMDEHRFFYVMPYHPGEHLGILTRQMHGECGGRGLDHRRLAQTMSYIRDLLVTLSAYHKGGLWHKDVKPENVIVHDGRAHLVDLGLVTPLKSAMTLTTHGTEYFRDPEMVRQALRGVKVHQVDGAKFDIYAVGAVLYFMIENTFPAHGGLSRFATRSPEALRWIVRRAMTEYHQRYNSADEMLADLEYVMSASDAFAVKPAELPSMRGQPVVEPVQEEAEVVAVAHSAAPSKPAFEGFGFVGGIDERGSFAQVGNFNLDENGRPVQGNPSTPSSRSSRPRLVITNWWTGAYRPDENVEEISHRDLRKEAFAFRDQAEEIRRQVRMGTMSARRAAREQIKAARERAKAIRARASAHRRRVVPQPRTSLATIVIGSLSVVFLGSILAITFFGSGSSSRGRIVTTSVGGAGMPVVLVTDSLNTNDTRLRAELDKIIAERRRGGYEIIVDPAGNHEQLHQLVQQWYINPTGQVEQAIEAALAARNLYGVLYVDAKGEHGKAARELRQTLIRSTREDAGQRRVQSATVASVAPVPPALPYLLINDHPAKADPAVEARVQQIIDSYREQGWSIAIDDDAEVEVRKVLPTGVIDPSLPPSPMLLATLADRDLGGVLRIDARPGEGSPVERITITRIDRGAIGAAADVELPSPPPSPASGAADQSGPVGCVNRFFDEAASTVGS